MFKMYLMATLVVSTIAAPAIAANDPQQARVQDYCSKVSSIILIAASDYNHQLSNAVKPEQAKTTVTQKVLDSQDYINASPVVKTEIDNALNQSTDYVEFSKMMAEQDKIHERYVGMHAWTWAYHNVTPFIAWCNYNHMSG